MVNHKQTDTKITTTFLWRIGIVAVFAAIPILLYAKYYFSNQIIGDLDLVQVFTLWKAWTNNLIHGDFSLWNPYLSGGVPQVLLGGQYPLSFLLSFFPLKQFIFLYFFVHLFMAGFFFYSASREMQVKELPAFIFAVLYESSTHINGYRKGHPCIVAGICLIPLLFFFVQRFFRKRKLQYLFASAIVMGMIFTIYIQLAAYLLMVLCVYLVVRLLIDKEKVVAIIKYAIGWLAFFVGTTAYMLVPYLGLLREYSQYGSNGTSYDTFCSFSMSPLKIVQMIYPTFYGDVMQAYGPQYSTEMDIEIYLGIFVLVMLISAFILEHKNKEFCAEFVGLILALMLTCVAHIPVFNKLMYHIPVIGGFRCSGRALSIFIFFAFVISAKLFNEIYSGEHNLRWIRGVIYGLLNLTIVSTILSTCFHPKLAGYDVGIFLPDCIRSGAILLIVCGSFLFFKKNKQLVSFVLLFVSIIDVYPYTSCTQPTDMKAIDVDSAILNTIDDREYKVWDDFANVDGTHVSLISQNKNSYYEISAINSMTAINNPLLAKYLHNLGEGNPSIPFNLSGLFTGTIESQNILCYQNDLLSMLSVKYILDTEGLLDEDGIESIDFSDEQELLYKKNELHSVYNSDSLRLFEPCKVKDTKTMYLISFDVPRNQVDGIDSIAIDLYGGTEFDEAGYEKKINLDGFDGHVSEWIYLDEIPNTVEDVCIRVMVNTESEDITINNISVMKSGVYKSNPYVLVETEDGVGLYENTNAQPILYSVDNIELLNANDDIYTIRAPYDLDGTAYVFEELPSDEYSKVNLTNIDYTTDTISANYSSKQQGFICFSQVYNSNWEVYIDNEKKETEIVNGLIMGVSVPKGNHTIEFRYTDYKILIGAAITVATIVVYGVMVFCLMRKERKHEEKMQTGKQ